MRRKHSVLYGLLIMSCLCLNAAALLHAAELTFTGGSDHHGWWDETDQWYPEERLPTATDDVIIPAEDSWLFSTYTKCYVRTTGAVCNSVLVGCGDNIEADGDKALLEIETGGGLTTNTLMISKSRFEQDLDFSATVSNYGWLTAQYIHIGYSRNPGVNAYFRQNDGQLTAHDLNVGSYMTRSYSGNLETYGSNGYFYHAGGNVTVNHDLNIGLRAYGEYNYYNIDTSQYLQVNNDAYVGKSTTGKFNQSTGQVRVQGTLYIGYYAGSSGTYNMHNFYGSPPTLTARKIVIGNPDGTAYGLLNCYSDAASPDHRISVNAGSVIVNPGGKWILAADWYSNTHITLAGGRIECSGYPLKIATGTLTIDSGTLQTMGNTEIHVGTGMGVLIQNGGEVVMPTASPGQGIIRIGLGAWTEGVYHLNGGTVTARDVSVGTDYGWGTLNIHGGQMNLASSLTIGWRGQFEQDGGTCNITGTYLQVGQDDHSDDGRLTLSGGTLQAPSARLVQGTLHQTGGNLNASANVIVGTDSAKACLYEISAGSVTTPQLTVGAPAGPRTATFHTIGSSQVNADHIIVQPGGTWQQDAANWSINNLITVSGGQINSTVPLLVAAGKVEVDSGIVNAEGQPINLGKGGRGYIWQIGGTVTANSLNIGYEAGSKGLYELFDGTLAVSGAVVIGRADGQSNGLLRTCGRTTTLTADSVTINPGGQWDLYMDWTVKGTMDVRGGTLHCEQSVLTVGDYQTQDNFQPPAQMSVSAGTVEASNITVAGYGSIMQSGGSIQFSDGPNEGKFTVGLDPQCQKSATYAISSGSLSVPELEVGCSGPGWLRIDGWDVQINISRSLHLGEQAAVSSKWQPTINLDDGADLLIDTREPNALAGLAGIIININNDGSDASVLEATARPWGRFGDNIAVGGLFIGQDTAAKLANDVNNGHDSEAFYTQFLVMKDGSLLDLDGNWLFIGGNYVDALHSLVDAGNIIDTAMPPGGRLYIGWASGIDATYIRSVPEPATLLVLLGGLPFVTALRRVGTRHA